MAIVAKYSLNGNANDSAGSNNGTATNVTYVAGKSGQAGSFDGSSSFISASYSTLNNFTVSLLIKGNTNPLNTPLTQTINFGNDAFGFSYNHGENTFIQAFFLKNTLNTYFASKINSITLQANIWYNIDCTYNGSNLISYLNGIQETTTPITGTIASSTLLNIGRSTAGGANFDGLIDEVKIHNTVLTPTQVKNKYLYYNGFI